jgi:hypothetical protein
MCVLRWVEIGCAVHANSSSTAFVLSPEREIAGVDDSQQRGTCVENTSIDAMFTIVALLDSAIQEDR